ncbi:hypothetical protein E2C01_004060 [Portunus trituberculatus]|uniref:Uncharacterized protein n=1 Tax=Portunus trituberculatus TaxID=210409 RepID=A0A5B7CSZ1_PORTR|nr:hypothetical protein [Portunus trituberculatus]
MTVSGVFLLPSTSLNTSFPSLQNTVKTLLHRPSASQPRPLRAPPLRGARRGTHPRVHLRVRPSSTHSCLSTFDHKHVIRGSMNCLMRQTVTQSNGRTCPCDDRVRNEVFEWREF